MLVGVVNYGAGNLMSVMRALEEIGCSPVAVEVPADLVGKHAVVLPGVGAFGAAMARLRQTGLDCALAEWVGDGKPLLGICLGMQLLFEESEEGGNHRGLGLLKGTVKRFKIDPPLIVPHMGWNLVSFQPGSRLAPGGDASENGGSGYFYFAHSYYCEPVDGEVVYGRTLHGVEFAAEIEVPGRPLFGVQFHPEKSGTMGLELLRKFLEDARQCW